MDRTTVFTKTAKGITQVNQRSASLSKDLMKVLKLIDGKSNFGQIMEKSEFEKNALEKALNTLTRDGYARIFEVRKDEADPFAEEDDFDFTAPGKMPAATQRVVPGAANDISELVRQQEKADVERKAREQAHEQARLRAKTEAESRAKLEAEARAKAQAEQHAMEQARRAKEAADRARAEVETKLREEETRRKALAEQQARLTAEQKAKEEAESRRLAELRAKAESEARALAEARARAEAEAQALAKARAEAEAAAMKQAKEATSAEQQLKARLKEEIESRIRSEMEELLRNELEEKARNEMRAQILEEARLAAKAELEERLREEREALARAETEARAKAETEARARAEREAKLRAEAEARAKAESEARMRAEADARSAREEADARARDQQAAEQRLEAERRAKYEAEARAKIEAEERERRERELQATLEEERKAKQAAETRARIEARARETIAEDTRVKVQAELEADLTKRAEIEGKAQAKAYMEAKARAEHDEDERVRAEQERKAREIADILRTRVEPDEVAPEAPVRRRRPRRRGNVAKTAFISVVALLVLGFGALHVIPLRPYAAKLERTMSVWLHDDVSIGAVKFRVFPTPHLSLENLSVGKVLDAKATTGQIYLDIGTLFGDRPSINRLELDNVSLSAEAVRRIPTWAAPEGKGKAGDIAEISLHGVTLQVKPAIAPFNADFRFGRDGALTQANLRSTGGGWNVQLRPAEKGYTFAFNASNWTPPVGAPITIADATLNGTVDANQLVVPEFQAHVLEGNVNGTLKVDWQSGVRLESDLSVSHMNAKDLMHAFTPDLAVTGKLDGNFNVAAEAPTAEALFDAPSVQGRFKLSEGSISNVDLVAVMQSDAAGQRAGVTKFAELAGEYAAGEHRAAYRQLSLQGGVLRGTGGVELAPNGGIGGRLALEIRSQVAQDRGAFTVSGTVARPIIKRGG
ncbi:MAG TPA: hypothetical protein VLS49_09210 [Usitatibacter sp.]|nr:hypothetical protein [Usitatibacter sp.]